MRCNPSRWLWGLIPIVMLSWAAYYRERAGIEADLSQRATEAMAAAGQPWAAVDFSGRDAVITGRARKDGEPKTALDAVRSVWGVRKVELKTDLATGAPSISPAIGPLAGDEAMRAARKQAASSEPKAAEETARKAAEAKAAEEAARKAAEAKAAEEAARKAAEAKAAEEAQKKAAAEKAKKEAEMAAAAEKKVAHLPRETSKDTALCEQRLKEAASRGTILFRRAKSDIDAESSVTIARLAEIVKSCPGTRVEVEGHTDSEGEPERNQNLSERRARAVVRSLIYAGVPASRLTAVGYGAGRPVASNDTPEGMAKNRRIEFKVFAN